MWPDDKKIFMDLESIINRKITERGTTNTDALETTLSAVIATKLDAPAVDTKISTQHTIDNGVYAPIAEPISLVETTRAIAAEAIKITSASVDTKITDERGTERAHQSSTYGAGVAAVMYVSATGSDANSGLVSSKAKLTIGAAVAALPVAGGIVEVGAGTFVITAQIALVDNTIIRGQGQGTLIQVGSGANCKALLINGKYNVRVESLSFDGRKATGNADNVISIAGASGQITLRDLSVVNAGYAAVAVSAGSSAVILDGLRLSANYVGIQVAASSDVKVSNVHILTGTAATTYEGGVTVTGSSRVHFVNCSSRSNAGHGAWVGSSDDVRFTNCAFSLNGTAGNDHRGMTIDGTATGVSFVNCVAKGNVEAGWYSAVGSVVRLVGCDAEGNNTNFRPGGHGFELLGAAVVEGCRALGTLGDAANEGCGFYLAGPASLQGCVAESNYSVGIRVYDGTDVTVNGGRVLNNSQRLAGGHVGIELSGATATTDVTVTNVRAYDTQGTKTQGYGVSVGATVNNYVIQGNNLRGNITGGLLDGGGANKVVANNLLT